MNSIQSVQQAIGTFAGGLYAVSTPAELGADKVTKAWDRLLSEWLPKSTFDLADHPLVEEFLTYHGTVTRMKLYLPVRRKLEPVMIEMDENQGSQYRPRTHRSHA